MLRVNFGTIKYNIITVLLLGYCCYNFYYCWSCSCCHSTTGILPRVIKITSIGLNLDKEVNGKCHIILNKNHHNRKTFDTTYHNCTSMTSVIDVQSITSKGHTQQYIIVLLGLLQLLQHNIILTVSLAQWLTENNVKNRPTE